MSENNRTFKRGSGCYKCGSCGCMTRDTGNDEGPARLCLACYELAGWENTMQDNPHDSENYRVALRESTRLRAEITAKGGAL